MRCYLNIEVILLNNIIIDNINFTMDKDINSKDKKIIFKELILEYLIKNLIGDTNVK